MLLVGRRVLRSCVACVFSFFRGSEYFGTKRNGVLEGFEFTTRGRFAHGRLNVLCFLMGALVSGNCLCLGSESFVTLARGNTSIVGKKRYIVPGVSLRQAVCRGRADESSVCRRL